MGRRRSVLLDPEQLRLHRETGFSSLQIVAEDYAIENGFLVPKGRPWVHTWSPMTKPHLSELVERLKNPLEDPTSVVRFARRYGLLGYAGLASAPAPGDPLEWLWEHIRTVRFVKLALSLTVFWREHDARELLAPYVVQETPDGAWTLVVVRYAAGAGVRRLSLTVPADFNRQHVQRDLARAAAEIISANISGISRRVWAGERGLKSAFTFRALVEVVYWHLLNAGERGALRVCVECLRPFIVTDARQRFCPPDEEGRESRCAVRHRQRRFQRRRRGGEATATAG